MAGSLGLVALSRGLLGAFLEHTSQESRFWRYVSDSSCWVYRIHMPLAGLVPAALMGLPLPLFLKYPLAVALVGAVSWLSCDVLVRNTALGVLLNGRRSPPARPGLRAGGLLLLLFLGGLSLSRSTGSSSQSAWAQGLPAEELLPGTVTLAAEDLAAASGWGAALDDCVQVEDWILCPEEVSRLEALALCALLDASLAAPETEAAWKDLQAKVARLSERTLWLGFDDRREEGRWVRQDGSPLDDSPWASGQPDDYQQSEDCAHMSWGEERLLNDVSCYAEQGFVCALKAPSAETGG